MKFTPVLRYAVTVVVFLWGLSLQTSHAQQSDLPSDPTLFARPLSATQLTSIRSVGRHVLAAKKSGPEDGDDVAQLTRLRSSLDALIAADLDPRNRSSLTVQGQEDPEQRTARSAMTNLRESARVNARAVVSQLRQRGDARAALARTQPQLDTQSAGLPIGKQRAELFKRWSDKLDAALADGNEDRTTQLLELRDKLQASKGRVTETARAHGTPTLQAMPAGYVPPEMPTQNDGAAKQEGK